MLNRTFTTNDGCKISYQTSQEPSSQSATSKTCILLMHGFSGSSQYFVRNYDELSRQYWVVAPDMRGHGNSGRPRGGYHVARLAMDLRELIKHLQAQFSKHLHVVPVGCSIGAAILWTYVELYGCSDFLAGFVFVDQAPLQDQLPPLFGLEYGAWDAAKSHHSCYDEETLREAQQAWLPDRNDRIVAYDGLVEECLGYRHEPQLGDNVKESQKSEDEKFFVEISKKCDGKWLARLMEDHTRYDHREAIEMITAPTLVMAGYRSGCFPLRGTLETSRLINKNRPGLAKESMFDAGHWLFYEQPERFNKEILEFVEECEKFNEAENGQFKF
ncbi:Alpha/Beta hydrolase protein [Diplogelasinospora grovesii]|uniref:Alpha/Beta hydrolase protein n=1 Tax=Diplogelasinospora grovesii TaxID=303347 RepID=A0AAN6RYM2_9PEZI|nr:Alpha/Beta hydrolase protein [Diplogelasinospora grovesii]